VHHGDHGRPGQVPRRPQLAQAPLLRCVLLSRLSFTLPLAHRALILAPRATDSTGAPRPVVNSKGRRRRPASKSLAAVLKCDDDLFVDFIAKCLAWDPERRLKPDQAMRHPFVAGSRAHAAQSTIPSRSSRSSTALTSSTSSRHASYGATGSGSSPSISTPMKKAAAPSSVSTAPTARTRTMSSATATAIGTARYSAKASLPASSRYAKA